MGNIDLYLYFWRKCKFMSDYSKLLYFLNTFSWLFNFYIIQIEADERSASLQILLWNLTFLWDTKATYIVQTAVLECQMLIPLCACFWYYIRMYHCSCINLPFQTSFVSAVKLNLINLVLTVSLRAKMLHRTYRWFIVFTKDAHTIIL